MEQQKILNLLNEEINYRFVTSEVSIVNDQSNANYYVGNGFIYSTDVLKTNVCNYNDD